MKLCNRGGHVENLSFEKQPAKARRYGWSMRLPPNCYYTVLLDRVWNVILASVRFFPCKTETFLVLMFIPVLLRLNNPNRLACGILVPSVRFFICGRQIHHPLFLLCPKAIYITPSIPPFAFFWPISGFSYQQSVAKRFCAMWLPAPGKMAPLTSLPSYTWHVWSAQTGDDVQALQRQPSKCPTLGPRVICRCRCGVCQRPKRKFGKTLKAGGFISMFSLSDISVRR